MCLVCAVAVFAIAGTTGTVAERQPSRKRAIPASGLLMGLALAAGCVAEFITGPVVGLYFVNRSVRRFRGPFRVATIGAAVSVISLILDAFISHTQGYSLQAVGSSNFLYQNLSAHTNISRFFDPAAAFFLTHIGIVFGWILIAAGIISARRLAKRQASSA